MACRGSGTTRKRRIHARKDKMRGIPEDMKVLERHLKARKYRACWEGDNTYLKDNVAILGTLYDRGLITYEFAHDTSTHLYATTPSGREKYLQWAESVCERKRPVYVPSADRYLQEAMF